MTDDLISTTAAAAHCHLSPRTLEKRRCEAGGPPYYKVGRKVLLQPAGARRLDRPGPAALDLRSGAAAGRRWRCGPALTQQR